MEEIVMQSGMVELGIWEVLCNQEYQFQLYL